MSVKKEPSGRRSIQVETEVQGTPEEVWQAIATGPGISSWFVPTQSEERVGGKMLMNFGPGMDSAATITAWDAPRQFAAESDGLGAGAPPMATEWTVEARDGGKCLVRVVHSLFASTDDWDDQLAGMESGWPSFFVILRLYLTDFRGQACSTFQVMGISSEGKDAAWKSLIDSLGLSETAPDRHWKAPAGVPPLAGYPRRSGGDQLLRLDEPAPGIAIVNACGMGGQTFLSLNFYLYGEKAAAAVARDQPLWQSWMTQRYPVPAPAEA